MQYRSIVSLFFLVCLLIISLFGNVAESRNPLERSQRTNDHGQTKHKTLLQRMKRRSRSTSRRRRRDDDNSVGNDADTFYGSPSNNDQFQPNSFNQK